VPGFSRAKGAGAASLAVVSEDGGNLPKGAVRADLVAGHDVRGGSTDGTILDHLQGQPEMLGLSPQPGAAQNQDRGVDGHGSLGLRNTAPGQPGVLPLQQRFKASREAVLIEFTGLVAFELTVQTPRQTRQHQFDQCFVNVGLDPTVSQAASVLQATLRSCYSTQTRGGCQTHLHLKQERLENSIRSNALWRRISGDFSPTFASPVRGERLRVG